jgi:hypothetical protein
MRYTSEHHTKRSGFTVGDGLIVIGYFIAIAWVYGSAFSAIFG